MRRQIFTANKFEGLIHKEIADRNGITTTRVDNEPRKTISALRFSLKDYPTIFVSMKHSPPRNGPLHPFLRVQKVVAGGCSAPRTAGPFPSLPKKNSTPPIKKDVNFCFFTLCLFSYMVSISSYMEYNAQKTAEIRFRTLQSGRSQRPLRPFEDRLPAIFRCGAPGRTAVSGIRRTESRSPVSILPTLPDASFDVRPFQS